MTKSTRSSARQIVSSEAHIRDYHVRWNSKLSIVFHLVIFIDRHCNGTWLKTELNTKSKTDCNDLSSSIAITAPTDGLPPKGAKLSASTALASKDAVEKCVHDWFGTSISQNCIYKGHLRMGSHLPLRHFLFLRRYIIAVAFWKTQNQKI